MNLIRTVRTVGYMINCSHVFPVRTTHYLTWHVLISTLHAVNSFFYYYTIFCWCVRSSVFHFKHSTTFKQRLFDWKSISGSLQLSGWRVGHFSQNERKLYLSFWPLSLSQALLDWRIHRRCRPKWAPCSTHRPRRRSAWFVGSENPWFWGWETRRDEPLDLWYTVAATAKSTETKKQFIHEVDWLLLRFANAEFSLCRCWKLQKTSRWCRLVVCLSFIPFASVCHSNKNTLYSFTRIWVYNRLSNLSKKCQIRLNYSNMMNYSVWLRSTTAIALTAWLWSAVYLH